MTSCEWAARFLTDAIEARNRRNAYRREENGIGLGAARLADANMKWYARMYAKELKGDEHGHTHRKDAPVAVA